MPYLSGKNVPYQHLGADKQVEAQVNAYTNAQRSKRLRKLWHDRTETQTPADWSQQYSTPILCMFDDNKRQKAKEESRVRREVQTARVTHADNLFPIVVLE